MTQTNVSISEWQERSGNELEFQLKQVRAPSYGRYLENFEPGETFFHPRGVTFNSSFVQDFATTFMESCPLFLNREYPLSLDFKAQPVPPLMVLATTLSLGVQNISEKAIAHLGYYNVRFPRVTYVGETLRAMSRVVDKKQKEPGKPGIVHVQTIGVNENDQVCVQYERKVLVPSGGEMESITETNGEFAKKIWNWSESVSISLPTSSTQKLEGWTSGKTFFEDFDKDQVILHENGRTITDEHIPWTYRLGNTHPLHFDSVYSHAQSAPMGGDPVVYGGLVFSWIAGLASRDTTENMVWDFGYNEGYHTQPLRSGDTLYAISRVLDKSELGVSGAGEVCFQLIGLKNISSRQALEKYGNEIFIKENIKKKNGLEKIPAKVFEIERKVCIRKRK